MEPRPPNCLCWVTRGWCRGVPSLHGAPSTPRSWGPMQLRPPQPQGLGPASGMRGLSGGSESSCREWGAEPTGRVSGVKRPAGHSQRLRAIPAAPWGPRRRHAWAGLPAGQCPRPTHPGEAALGHHGRQVPGLWHRKVLAAPGPKQLFGFNPIGSSWGLEPWEQIWDCSQGTLSWEVAPSCALTDSQREGAGCWPQHHPWAAGCLSLA